MWQFADLDNVHIVPNFDSIPEIVEKRPPVMQPFDMDATIDAIVNGAKAKPAG